MELSAGIRLPLLSLQYLRLPLSANEMGPYLILGNPLLKPHSIYHPELCSLMAQISDSKLGPYIRSLSLSHLNNLEREEIGTLKD